MKYLLLLLLPVLSYSQVNRYTDLSTSKYNTNSSTTNVIVVNEYNPIELYKDYYKTQSEQRIDRIKQSMDFFYENFDKILKSLPWEFDPELKRDITEIQPYFNTLQEARSMDLDEAEAYIDKITKMYNKAIKRYNKRMKDIHEGN